MVKSIFLETDVDRLRSFLWRRCLCTALAVAAPVPCAVAGPAVGRDAEGPAGVNSTLDGDSGAAASRRGVTDPGSGLELSTGNKSVDLLLGGGRPAGPVASGSAAGQARGMAASVPAAGASAGDGRHELPGKQSLRKTQQADQADRAKLFERPFGSAGIQDDESEAGQPNERRVWSGNLGGSTSFTGNLGGGSARGDHPSGAGRAHVGVTEDSFLGKLPREVMAYLRENRYWILGGLALLVVAGAAINARMQRAR